MVLEARSVYATRAVGVSGGARRGVPGVGDVQDQPWRREGDHGSVPFAEVDLTSARGNGEGDLQPT